ncbi:MAG: ResB family protein [Nocardioides sp.]|jgi:cytochrome c biogenesis protein|uniref:cytochrome c biogenesis protein ResB n=1 Tax=Nocardioides sp. TaxID=35761 RepID=UPI00260F7632|nr:cytochrome c biogenesis protein ResB [Nocardioides sp.]MCW2835660.1 ResB family protein [Nocardioides sp.]
MSDTGGRDRQATPMPNDMNARELGRWLWRQLTSMRTALVLLLLLALAAIPGSIVPQEDVDSIGVSRWQDAHPELTPVYEKLGLFSVYDSPWFSAIYILLMISLVGCIVPRTGVYWRALRAKPPRAPRNLSRLPEHAAYTTHDGGADVLERAAAELKRRRYRVVVGEDSVSAEKGYLREAGNLVFHISVLVVLVGFAMGGLFGYKGGVIVVEGQGFSNDLTQYDDFVPGSMFTATDMEPFSFTVEDFEVDWLTEGPRAGMARKFVSTLGYQETPSSAVKSYDLRVNHPLKIGTTEIFLIGHGYAPVITVRDGNGDVAYSGPTIFLPVDETFQSFGVVKAADARPGQIGLEGEFYPTFALGDGLPRSSFGDLADPVLSMLVYTGDLGLDGGGGESVYVLDKSNAEQVLKEDGKPFRLDMREGDSIVLPDDLGTVTFEGIERWNKIQISRTPGKLIALTGVSLALLGLCASLFIRPRRVWVRTRRDENGETVVDLGALDRSNGGDPERGEHELAAITLSLQGTGKVSP